MSGGNTVAFTDDNFEAEVLKANVPVVVDFWAEWCMPCKALSPIIDELASEYVGKVKIGKVDTDSNRKIALQYQINSIPTVMFFHKGKLVERFVGLRSKKDIKAALDKLVSV